MSCICCEVQQRYFCAERTIEGLKKELITKSETIMRQALWLAERPDIPKPDKIGEVKEIKARHVKEMDFNTLPKTVFVLYEKLNEVIRKVNKL